ncbi:peptidase T [Moritella sp.]|uniref:peptidase T n=1 Tax=Moritella sp. TaxID=78556 RepID=UPI0025D78DA2|nr:peptidase T [Moritella sp.]MCJ8351973.1 peptidase T [Moritella sp.]
MDTYKIIMTIIAVFSIGFNIYQFLLKRPRFKFRMSYGLEPNEDGVGNFLCARLFVSNTGGEAAIYNGLEGADEKGDVFYPSCSIEVGSKVEPNASVVGYITNGHLLTHGTSSLFIVDGVFNKHKVPKKVLDKLLSELKKEKNRLESLGCKVHPPSLFEIHNKSKHSDAASCTSV